MASRCSNLLTAGARAFDRHSRLLAFLFQSLLLCAVFNPTPRLLAGIALIVTLLLAAAQILCTCPGSYLYKFPGEIQI